MAEAAATNIDLFDGVNLPTKEVLQLVGLFKQKVVEMVEGFGRLSADVQSVLDEIRMKIYVRGIGGGPEAIHQRAIELARAGCEGVEPTDDQVRMWRSYVALLELSTLHQDNIDRHLGDALGVMREPNSQRALDRFFRDGKLIRFFDEGTNLSDMMDLIALTEGYEMDEVPVDKELLRNVREEALSCFVKRVLTGDPELLKVCLKYFDLDLCRRVLASVPGVLGEGRIGGKAVGLLIAYAILEREIPEFDAQFAAKKDMSPERLRERVNLKGALEHNVSELIGSGVFDMFVKANEGLAECGTFKHGFDSGGVSEPNEAKCAEIRAAVMAAKFPDHIERQLRDIFTGLHGTPIVIRSSSELEDRVGAAFSGKYKSVYLMNNGDFEKDFELCLQAMKTVYASMFDVNVMEYRARTGLLKGHTERMGILVQTLNGEKRGDLHYPMLAGVAQSQATQSFGPDPERGAMKIVCGLGEAAVDWRQGRFVMFEAPTKRIADDARKQAYQTEFCVGNAAKNEIQRMKLTDFLRSGGVDMAALSQIFSKYDHDDDRLRPVAMGDLSSSSQIMASFDGVVGSRKNSEFPLLMEYLVQKLKYALGYDVDIEFTANHGPSGYRVKVVQCRPQNIPESFKPCHMPKEVPAERVLLSSDRNLSCGRKANVRYVVYIPPEVRKGGNGLTEQEVNDLQHWIAKLNAKLEKNSYLIVSPGNWGSRDADNGIPAGFAAFSKAAGFFELTGQTAQMTSSYSTNPSFGSHFWNDAVEAGMNTFGVNMADCDGDVFRREILEDDGANCAGNFLEDLPERFRSWLKVVDVEKAGQAMAGDKSEWRLHVAQTNRGKGARPARVYFARKGEDLPVAA